MEPKPNPITAANGHMAGFVTTDATAQTAMNDVKIDPFRVLIMPAL